MTIKVFDTFIGSNGVDIDVHTPDTDIVGTGWTSTGVNTVELDGTGAIKFSTANDAAWIDTGETNQRIETTFYIGSADNRMSIFARHDGAAHATRTCYEFNFRTDDVVNTFKISKTIGGTQTTLIQSGPFTVDNTATYIAIIIVDGENLSISIDGIGDLSTTDPSITTGSYSGLKHEKIINQSQRFNDFKVEDITGAVTFNGIYGQGGTQSGSVIYGLGGTESGSKGY